MDELVEEFGRILNQLPGDSLAGSIELLIQQMESDSAMQLRLCAIPHQFDPSILQVLALDLDAAQAERRCVEFSKISIIIGRHDGLAMHDEARHHLFSEWLRPQNVAEFTSASARLVEYFDQCAANVSGELLEIMERKRMFHLVGADQARGFQEFERLFRQMHQQFRLNECKSLIDMAHEYDSILTPEHAAWLAYHEGMLAADLHQLTRAEQLFNQILHNRALEPELHANAYNRLGMIYAEQRHWHAAIDFYQKALQLAKTIIDSHDLVYCLLHELGAAYRDSGDLTQASKLLQDSIKMATEKSDFSAMALGYNSLGTLYRKLSYIRQAIEAYEKSLDCLEHTQDKFRPAQVYNNLGVAYADIGEWQQSEQFFLQSLEIKHQAGDTLGQAMTLNNLVQVYRNLNLHQRAIESSQQAIELFGEMRDFYNIALTKCNLGRLYRSMQSFDLCCQAFRESIELFNRCNASEDAAAIHKELGALTHKTGLRRWVSILAISFSLIIFIVGLVFIIMSKQDYIDLGNKLNDLGNYEQAIENFNKSIKMNAYNVTAYQNRGWSYLNLRQYDHANTDYNKALEIDPNNSIVYNNRGLAYTNLHKYEQAVTDYTKSIEIDQGYALSYSERGRSYIELEQYDRAIEDFNKSIEIDPSNAFYYTGRGRAYQLLGNKEKSEIDYLKAFELQEERTSTLLILLAVLYWQDDKQERAKEYFQQALEVAQKEVKKDPSNYRIIAISQLGIGLTDEGLETYRYAVEVNKGVNIDAHLKNLELLRDSPKPLAGVQEALQLLEQANGR